VELTVKVTYLGHEYELTLKSDVAEDLSKFNVQGRISSVLAREAQRCAEITAVALKDKTAAELAELQARERKARGEVLPAAPAQILAAGTKAPEGRTVVEVAR
jgi:hypothetical protein